MTINIAESTFPVTALRIATLQIAMLVITLGSVQAQNSLPQTNETKAQEEAAQADAEANVNGDVDQLIHGIGAASPTGDEVGVTLRDPVDTNWRVGVLVLGGNRPVTNLNVAIPVPGNWPEQTVEIFKEEFPAEITDVDYDTLEAGPYRLVFRIPDVGVNQKILALATYRVSTMQIVAPADTTVFKFPPKKTKETKPYLVPSPEIAWRDQKLKKKAKELIDIQDSDWKKVESIYDWIRESIETRAGDPVGSQAAFRAKSGASEDVVSLFVAMCRANKIPARMVFVDGAQYAEFYLIDTKDELGHWFPANVAGLREFGEISEPRVILQKGDNIRVAGEKKRLKFVPAAATCKGTQPKAVRFVREPRPIDSN